MAIHHYLTINRNFIETLGQLIVWNQYGTGYVAGIELGLGAHIEHQRRVICLQLPGQLTRRNRLTGTNARCANQ